MKKRSPLFPPLPATKMNADNPQKTNTTEEPELLKKILIEAKHFSGPASENSEQPRKVKRIANGDRQGRRGTV